MRKYSKLARIHSLKTLTNKIYTIDIEYPEIASQVKPGQFIQLKLPEIESSIWPRPFSVHRADNSLITISIKKFGKITKYLETLTPGSMIFVIGPLGNSFEFPPQDKDLYFAAGGVGLPPLQFWAELPVP